MLVRFFFFFLKSSAAFSVNSLVESFIATAAVVVVKVAAAGHYFDAVDPEALALDLEAVVLSGINSETEGSELKKAVQQMVQVLRALQK